MDFPSVINLNCSNCKTRFSHLSSSVPLSPGSNLFDNGMNRKKYSNIKGNNANYIPVISHNNIHKTKISNENENENFMDVMNSFSPNRRKRENENENEDDRNDGRNISSSGQKYLIIDDDDCIDDNNNNNDINCFPTTNISNNFIIENNIMGTPKYKKNHKNDRKIESINKKMRICDDVIAISSFDGLSLEKVNSVNINIP